MPLTDAYDLSGLNSDRYLCGPYVCIPFQNGFPFNIDTMHQNANSIADQVETHPAAVVVNNGSYRVLDVLAMQPGRRISADASDVSPTSVVWRQIRDYHFGILAKFGVSGYLESLINQTKQEKYHIFSQIHWYPDRPKSAIQLHHDSIGATFFVILHYVNPNTIYGPEFVFDTNNPTFGPRSGLTTGPLNFSRQGPVDIKGIWPKALRERMNEARLALFEAYGESPIIKHALIPPFGAIGFVDELIHHTTPLMANRVSGFPGFPGYHDHSKGFSTVNVTEGSGSTSYDMKHTRARSYSVEKNLGSLNKVAEAATTSLALPRAFLRIWVTIKKM